MQWRIQGRGPGDPTHAYFQSKLGPEGPKPKKIFFLETSPPPYLMVLKTAPRPLSQGLDLAIQCCASIPGGGEGTPIHYIIIRVCAAQRGCDFEAPDLERGIHFRGVC